MEEDEDEECKGQKGGGWVGQKCVKSCRLELSLSWLIYRLGVLFALCTLVYKTETETDIN